MPPAPLYGTARQAAAHRDRLLGRTRAISLGLAGGALAACLGLGADFAHALPGHARPAAAAYGPGRRGTAGQPAARPRHRAGHARRARPPAPPAQPPASTTAPPQTVSGGS
jgi:hypothetical protein